MHERWTCNKSADNNNKLNGIYMYIVKNTTIFLDVCLLILFLEVVFLTIYIYTI